MPTAPSRRFKKAPKFPLAAVAMPKPLSKLKSSPRRGQVATPRVEARQLETFFFAQCPCDLADDPDWFEDLYHENGETSSHLQDCPQLGTLLPKVNRKRKSPGDLASYLIPEEEEQSSKAGIRREPARRQRKEAKRIQDAQAKAEAMRAVKPAFNPFTHCYCCDAFNDSEDDAVREEARTICHTHTDGTVSVQLPNCLRPNRFHHAPQTASQPTQSYT